MAGSKDESIEMGTFSCQSPEVSSQSSFVETPNMIYTASGKRKEKAGKRGAPITVHFPPSPSVPVTGTRFSVASVDIPMVSYQIAADCKVEKSKDKSATKNQPM